MKRILFFFALCIALFHCTPMDRMDALEYVVLDSEMADFYDLNKFDPMMENFAGLFNIVLDNKLTFSVAAIAYPTVDPNGEEVWASGLVYHPLNRKSKGVIDFLPMAHLNREAGSSEQLFITEGMLALLGYTIIIPDLLGSGSSKECMKSFLMAENTGRVSYDMHRAATQYIWDEFRVRLPAETTIMGYSLGGSAALATQKYFETHHANTVKVKEVFAGGGVYDLPVAFEAYAQSGVSGYPAIPLAIIAFDYYYKLNLDYSQVFTGSLLADDHYKIWLSGDYTAEELKEIIGTDLHGYLHPDFFEPFGQQNSEIEKLYPFLQENSLTEGWRPKAPIHLSYAHADIIVPAVCAEVAAQKLRKAGGHVSCAGYPGDHYTVGYLYYIRSMIHFLL
ncbi:MAG: hypothetical protein FWG54_05350 [Bacteroidetes bacterium]|nr:hypothetical protein [Bacteroidota bacterium]